MDKRAHSLFVIGVDIRMQEYHGYAFDAFRLELADGLARFGFVQRRDDPPAGVEALLDLKPQVTLHQRVRRSIKQVVNLFAGAAAKLEHVAEAPGRDQADAGAPLLHNRVNHQRRAMNDRIQGCQIQFEIVDAFKKALFQRAVRKRLFNPDAAGCFIERYKIDEGPADVNCQSLARHLLPSRSDASFMVSSFRRQSSADAFVEMAADAVAFADRARGRVFGSAVVHRLGAAGMEGAAGRWIRRAGRRAWQDDPLGGACRVWRRRRGKKRLRVRMLWVGE